jgi:outer membrane lipoprotein-sorting protein
MTPRRLAAGLVAAIAATACGPALAQMSFFQSIFGGKSDTAPESQAAPPSLTRAPLPPRRPASLAPGEAAASATDMQPETTATTTRRVAAAGPDVPVAAGPLSERAILDRANAYFNGIGTLTGDFTQIGADGRKIAGKIYLQRPGRLRFDYAPPSTLEIIADGSAVAIRDRKLGTQDLYFISQTPLSFLLRDQIDLARDLTLVGISAEPDGSARVMVEDRSTLGGTSRITLFFDGEVRALTQWRIIDPQGFQTTVVLSNIEKGRRIDQNLFVIADRPGPSSESSR